MNGAFWGHDARARCRIAVAPIATALFLLLSAALAAGYPTELNSGCSWVPIGPMPMTNQEPNFGGYVTGSPLANATGKDYGARGRSAKQRPDDISRRRRRWRVGEHQWRQ